MGAYSAAILGTSGLLSYWRLNETSGTTAADLGPAGVTLTYQSGVTLAQTGAIAYDAEAASVYSTTTNQMTASSITAYDSSWDQTAFTLEGWMRVPTSPSSGSYYNKVFRNSGFLLWLTVTTKYPSFVIDQNNTTSANWSSNKADNAWHHYVATFSKPTMTLYVDGVSRVTASWNYNKTAISSIEIGKDGYQYNCENAVYSRALSSAEVAYHYNLGLGTIANREQPRPRVRSQAANRAASY